MSSAAQPPRLTPAEIAELEVLGALAGKLHETHAIVQGLRASADDLHEQMRHVQAKLRLAYVPFKAAAWEVGQSLNSPHINITTNAPPFDD